MTIECKYNIGDRLRIRELEKTTGVVISIWVTATGVQYELRFFTDGKVQKEYFYENELEK